MNYQGFPRLSHDGRVVCVDEHFGVWLNRDVLYVNIKEHGAEEAALRHSSFDCSAGRARGTYKGAKRAAREIILYKFNCDVREFEVYQFTEETFVPNFIEGSLQVQEYCSCGFIKVEAVSNKLGCPEDLKCGGVLCSEAKLFIRENIVPVNMFV